MFFSRYIILVALSFMISVSNCETIVNTASPSASPVILVPGYGGSILHSNSTKSNKLGWFSINRDNNYRLYLDSFKMLLSSSKWINSMKLQYDDKTKRTRNQDGVFVNVPFWGETRSVESIDIHDTDFGKFFTSITESLVNRLDYRRDVSIRAAPYDFRKGPDEHEEYFVNLRQLVEDTYRQNNNTPVTFIAYSLGGRMTLIFLQRQTHLWKQKHVKTLITLGAPWFGSMIAMKNLLEGNNAGLDTVKPLEIRSMLRTFPSEAFLIPSGHVWEDFVTTPHKTYNREHMRMFFKEIGQPDISNFLTNLLSYRQNFISPGVEVQCLYGTGFNEVKRYRFKSDIHAEAQYEKDLGDGDGTVNIESLRGCELWNKTQIERVSTKSFPGVKHWQMLHRTEVLEHILMILADGRPVKPPRKTFLCKYSFNLFC